MRLSPRTAPCLLALGILAGCGGGSIADGGFDLGGGVRMIPAGRDAGGCPVYRMSGRDGGTLRSAFYRTPSGDFTTNRQEACR